MQAKPLIENYETIREFIEARFYWLAGVTNPRSSRKADKRGKTYSHRAFSKLAGLGSPNYLVMLIQGKRRLGAEGAVKVAKGLKLDANETSAFVNRAYLEADKEFQIAWNVNTLVTTLQNQSKLELVELDE